MTITQTTYTDSLISFYHQFVGEEIGPLNGFVHALNNNSEEFVFFYEEAGGIKKYGSPEGFAEVMGLNPVHLGELSLENKVAFYLEDHYLSFLVMIVLLLLYFYSKVMKLNKLRKLLYVSPIVVALISFAISTEVNNFNTDFTERLIVGWLWATCIYVVSMIVFRIKDKSNTVKIEGGQQKAFPEFEQYILFKSYSNQIQEGTRRLLIITAIPITFIFSWFLSKYLSPYDDYGTNHLFWILPSSYLLFHAIVFIVLWIKKGYQIKNDDK